MPAAFSWAFRGVASPGLAVIRPLPIAYSLLDGASAMAATGLELLFLHMSTY